MSEETRLGTAVAMISFLLVAISVFELYAVFQLRTISQSNHVAVGRSIAASHSANADGKLIENETRALIDEVVSNRQLICDLAVAVHVRDPKVVADCLGSQ